FLLIFSLLPLSSSFSKWYCGPSDHIILNSLLSLPCLHPNLNEICHEHDLCYDYQLGYEHCNEIMCNKLRIVDSGWCINESTAFFMCSVIRNFGRGRYITAGEKLAHLISKGEVTPAGVNIFNLMNMPDLSKR
ncbi:hypothetical protein PMAYCL1PPCAC_14842, partial [Pristionchus mayeri]